MIRWSCRFLLALLLGAAGCDDGAGYRRSGGRWHYGEQPLAGADAASFRALDRLFARDRQHGYYRGEAIEGSLGASFEVLSEHEARDDARVYWADTERRAQEYWSIKHVVVHPMAGADPVSYRTLGYGYGRDAASGWYQGRAFAVRDPASFEALDSRFARDAQAGYYERQAIPGSDGASFAMLDSDGTHARDRHRVYSTHIEINDPGGRRPHPVVRALRGADPATVRVPGGGYAIDGARVWWRGRLLAGADAASFEVLHGAGNADARDAGGPWHEGRRLSADELRADAARAAEFEASQPTR